MQCFYLDFCLTTDWYEIGPTSSRRLFPPLTYFTLREALTLPPFIATPAYSGPKSGLQIGTEGFSDMGF